MKSLGSKIFFGVLFLFAIIVALSVIDIVFINHLAESSRGTIVDNYRTIDYTTGMISALDEMYLSETERGASSSGKFIAAGKKFEQHLGSESANITEPGESELVIQLKADYTDFIDLALNKNAKLLNEFIYDTVDGVIISIGQNMVSSILAAHYPKGRNNRQVIVKTINENHAKILELMGADEVILPEKDMAISLAQKLSSNNMLEYLPLTSEFSIVEAAVPENYFGKSLREIKLRTKHNLLVIAVKDIMQDKFYLMPNADYKLFLDSLMVIMGKRNDIEKFNI